MPARRLVGRVGILLAAVAAAVMLVVMFGLLDLSALCVLACHTCRLEGMSHCRTWCGRWSHSWPLHVWLRTHQPGLGLEARLVVARNPWCVHPHAVLEACVRVFWTTLELAAV